MLLALLLLPLALAQDLGLREAVARASGSPSAALLAAEARAGEARARGLAWPTENPALHLEQEPDARSASLELPVDLALPARLAASGRAKDAAAIQAEIAQITPGLDAGELWLEARAAQDRAEATAWLARIAQQGADAAKARQATGEIAPEEAALLLADAIAAGGRARDAEAAARDALRRLSVALGEDPATSLTLASWEPVPDPPGTGLGIARIEAERVAEASEAAARLARAERLPALALSGGWQQAETDGAVIGASVELPLFGAREAQVARAEAQAARAAAELSALQDEDAQAAARQEVALATELLASWSTLDARAALDASNRRFEAGEIGPGEALARRALLSDALLSQIDARLRLERARLQLWALAGQLPWDVSP